MTQKALRKQGLLNGGGSRIRYIYDSNKKIIGKVEGDTIYDDYGKVKGYIVDDCIVDSRSYGKILYRFHDDGWVTEGTSRQIVAKIHEDGYITEGTSQKIAGKVDMPVIPIPGGGSAQSESGHSGSVWGLVLVGGFVIVVAVYFAIFMLPGFVVSELAEQIEKKDWGEFASLALTILAEVISSIIVNIRISEEKVKFSDRISQSFTASFITGAIVICISSLVAKGYTFGLIFASLLVSALFAILPTLILSTVFGLIYTLKGN